MDTNNKKNLCVSLWFSVALCVPKNINFTRCFDIRNITDLDINNQKDLCGSLWFSVALCVQISMAL